MDNQQGTVALLSVMGQPGWEQGLWENGYWDICMAESLCCSHETITALLNG